MKKIIALLLLAAMALTFIACSNNTANNDTDVKDTEEVVTDEETSEDVADVPAHKYENPETVAQKLCYAFEDAYAANNAITAQEMADTLITNEVILFGPATMPVEPGFLNGFDAEITDFSEAVMFSPMIGTIPFVGYVFTLAEGADAAAFISNLETNANLRWNICTEAEEMVTANCGNLVFFVMSPLSLEA